MKDKKLKIGIDARIYSLPGGLGRYTRELINGLGKQDTGDLEFVIFLDKEGYDSYVPQRSNFRKVLADVKWYGVSEQLEMPGIWKKEGPDLIHFTHFNKSILYRRPYVVTIHDLTYSLQKKLKISKLPPIIYSIKYWFYERIIKDTILKAKKVIVPTNYSKKDIVDLYKIAPERVAVTYESVDKKFSEKDQERPFGEVAKKFGIVSPYFFYVGNASPHKNLKKLIEGFMKLAEGQSGVQLVLAGKKEKFYKELENWNRSFGDKGEKVVFTDVVSDDELQVLLSNSYAFVFPSLAEGFGLPPLEAMASGTPVLVSSASCLPEVCQGAALYFDPYDPKDISAKMQKILEDGDLREDLVKRGLGHVKSFSWEKMAKETLEVYRDVLSKLKKSP